MKLQTNKPVPVQGIKNATVPDAIAKIGNLKLEDDGTLTYSIHFYENVTDADNDTNLISSVTYNMTINNLEKQIITNAKTQALFDQATDI